MRCLSVCPSVRLYVTFVDHVKTNKHIFEIFLPSGSNTILVFPYQTGWRYSGRNPPNWGVECGVGKKRDSGRISGFAAYRSTLLSTIRVAKCEIQSHNGQQQASSTPRRPSSVVRTRRRRSVCDGVDVICRRRRSNPLGHYPRFLLP